MKKIPDNAKKVFEGIIFDVYHWEQVLFDGSVTTFEALKRHDSVTVIAVMDNMIVLNTEEQPNKKEAFITMPGGNCEGEGGILEQAQRELREETGLTSSDWQEWFSVDPYNTSKIEWKNTFFIARKCTQEGAPILDPGEKITTSYISFDEFLELRNRSNMRNKDLFPVLEKAATDANEKQKLKQLLGITT
jgi:8-oxo-dGTP pyrophosphatase MutT (NUDIX family)